MNTFNSKFIIFSVFLFATALAHGMDATHNQPLPEERPLNEFAMGIMEIIEIMRRNIRRNDPRPYAIDHINFSTDEPRKVQRKLFGDEEPSALTPHTPTDVTDLATHPEVKKSSAAKGRKKGYKRSAKTSDAAPSAKKAKNAPLSPIKTDPQSLARLSETLDAAVAQQLTDYEKGLKADTFFIELDKNHPETILAALDTQLDAKQEQPMQQKYNLNEIYKDLARHNELRAKWGLEPLSLNNPATRYYYQHIYGNDWAPSVHGLPQHPSKLY